MKKQVQYSVARQKLRKILGGLIGALVLILTAPMAVLQIPRQLLVLLQSSLKFTPRPDDIFIVSYPRSGTTWLQMILYQLTSDGEMEFVHISQVVPWLERSIGARRNLDVMASPRVFKTHLTSRQMPRWPGKYIYITRDGKDVALSYFNFYKMQLGFKGSFADFFARFMKGKVQSGSWFKHVRGWRARSSRHNILFLNYEDLLTDLEGGIRQIIAFCGFNPTHEKFAALVQRSSFAFMKEHENKFDHATEVLWERGISQGSFINRGKAGGWKEQFTQEQKACFERTYEHCFGKTAQMSGTAIEEPNVIYLSRKQE